MRFVVLALFSVSVAVKATYQPKPETVDFLNHVLSQAERDLFVAWGDAPDAPSHEQIQLMLLEAFYANPHVPMEAVHAYITSQFPGYSESVLQLGARMAMLLDAVMKPVWLHTALLRWPGPITPSPALAAYLELWRPSHAKGRYVTAAGLIQAAVEWDAMCVSRLKAWDHTGKPPCGIQSTTKNGRTVSLAVVTTGLFQQYIGNLLATARAAVE